MKEKFFFKILDVLLSKLILVLQIYPEFQTTIIQCTTHSIHGMIYWFQPSPIQKINPKFIFQLITHCYIFELVLDTTWGAKKTIRNLKIIISQIQPKNFHFFGQNLVPNTGQCKFSCQTSSQNCIKLGHNLKFRPFA